MNFYEQIFSRGRATGEGMTHFERMFAAKFGGSPPPEVREYTGAVPVTITADGTPLLDYLITGNTTQNGTPTPENPVMPQGTGERTENMWAITPNAEIGYNQGVGADVSESTGTLQVSASDNGMILTANSSWESTAWKIQATVGMKYYISFGSLSSNLRATIYVADGNNKVTRKIANYSANFPSNKEVTIQSNEQFIVISLSVNDIATVEITKPMIATNIITYEPPGYKIPISSASVTTPIYLGEVQSTRQIKKLVLTGEENITMPATSSFQIFGVIQWGSTGGFCTHYQKITWDEATYVTKDGFAIHASSDGADRFRICDSSITTVADFKSYLAQQYANGTPVTVWYILATPETAVVNEPLMKIGDYADTVSKEQAGVTIPTNNGSTTVDVETTLKPSEVYIKYMG